MPFPLYLLDTVSLKAVAITTHYQSNTTVRWDEKLCPKPPISLFPAHGIHLSKREDGAWQLLAVNHERESVEMFEVDSSNKTPELIWRGCVVLPAGSVLNDVTALQGGGFLTSHMITLGDSPVEDIVKVNNANGPSGYVLRWRPGFGTDRLAGSEGDLTNGVAVSADGRSVFIAEAGAHRVKRIAYDSGELLGQVEAASDNLSWAKDGCLVVTGVTNLPDNCVTREGICRAAFEVRAIAPDTLESEVIFRSDGTPMGGGTVAVFQGDYMYVGSFMGDRLLRVRVNSGTGMCRRQPEAGASL